MKSEQKRAERKRGMYRRYTTRQRRAALVDVRELGLRAAAEKHGIPPTTLGGWCKDGRASCQDTSEAAIGVADDAREQGPRPNEPDTGGRLDGVAVPRASEPAVGVSGDDAGHGPCADSAPPQEAAAQASMRGPAVGPVGPAGDGGEEGPRSKASRGRKRAARTYTPSRRA
jgi:hypothetical protein